MFERHLFIRLKSEHATERGNAEVRARSQALAGVPGVRSLTIGIPADEGARGAWDLHLALRFDALGDIERFLQHPLYTAFQLGFLDARVQVIKAWNFEVEG